jgi:hypothetical protein
MRRPYKKITCLTASWYEGYGSYPLLHTPSPQKKLMVHFAEQGA